METALGDVDIVGLGRQQERAATMRERTDDRARPGQVALGFVAATSVGRFEGVSEGDALVLVLVLEQIGYAQHPELIAVQDEVSGQNRVVLGRTPKRLFDLRGIERGVDGEDFGGSTDDILLDGGTPVVSLRGASVLPDTLYGSGLVTGHGVVVVEGQHTVFTVPQDAVHAPTLKRGFADGTGNEIQAFW